MTKLQLLNKLRKIHCGVCTITSLVEDPEGYRVVYQNFNGISVPELREALILSDGKIWSDKRLRYLNA